MKRAVSLFAAVITASFLLSSMASAAEKLAYVDLSKLFDGYAKTKEFDALLAGKEKSYEAERDKKVKEIKQLQDKYSLLSEKEKENKRTEIESKVKSLEDFDKQEQSKLLKEREDKLKEIFKDIEVAIKQYAEAQGYTLVLNERFMLYGAANLDITGNVAEVLKASPSKGK